MLSFLKTIYLFIAFFGIKSEVRTILGAHNSSNPSPVSVSKWYQYVSSELLLETPYPPHLFPKNVIRAPASCSDWPAVRMWESNLGLNFSLFFCHLSCTQLSTTAWVNLSPQPKPWILFCFSTWSVFSDRLFLLPSEPESEHVFSVFTSHSVALSSSQSEPVAAAQAVYVPGQSKPVSVPLSESAPISPFRATSCFITRTCFYFSLRVFICWACLFRASVPVCLY